MFEKLKSFVIFFGWSLPIADRFIREPNFPLLLNRSVLSSAIVGLSAGLMPAVGREIGLTLRLSEETIDIITKVTLGLSIIAALVGITHEIAGITIAGMGSGGGWIPEALPIVSSYASALFTTKRFLSFHEAEE